MRRLAFVAILAAALAGIAPAQVAATANSGYKTAEGREAVAKSLADPARNETQRPRELVAAMGLQPGMQVADVGTGIGYMLPFLTQAVGAKGHVYAEDIAPDFLVEAKRRAIAEGLTNVDFIQGTDRDPRLPGDTLNAILVLDAYHHFDYPAPMLKVIHDSLLNDGRLVIVDYYRNAEAMPGGRALQHIRLDRDGVIQEVEANGFRLLSKHDHIPGKQYMAIFEKKP